MIIKKKKNGLNYIEIPIPKRVADLDKWCDNDYVLFFSMGMILEDYVIGECGGVEKMQKHINDMIEWNKEDPDSYFNCEPQIKADKEIIRLFRMWRKFPEFSKKAEDLYLMKGTHHEWFYWENKIKELQDSFMKRLIDVRPFLWT